MPDPEDQRAVPFGISAPRALARRLDRLARQAHPHPHGLRGARSRFIVELIREALTHRFGPDWEAVIDAEGEP